MTLKFYIINYQLIFYKDAKAIQWRRQSFQKLCPYAKKKKSSQLQTYLTSCAKFNSKLIMDKHNKPKAD